MAELLALDGAHARVTARPSCWKTSRLHSTSGDSLALLGRNGVGKTTLLVTLMGLTRVHSGATPLARRAISRARRRTSARRRVSAGCRRSATCGRR